MHRRYGANVVGSFRGSLAAVKPLPVLLWREHAPSADDENSFIDNHGFGDFAAWHMGRDDDKSDGTKGSVSFPFGDFKRVHRCAVISLESRAAQYGHTDIRDAAKKLLELIDSE